LVIALFACAVSGITCGHAGSVFVATIILMLVGASTAFVLVVTSLLETKKA
jgi:hypothetical protein